MGIKTFEYRLYPTKSQKESMFQVLNVCRNWYNMMLEQRKLAWESARVSITLGEQKALGKRYRITFPQAKIVSAQTLQNVALDLDKAFRGFFQRFKEGTTPGYPRFKSKRRYNSFLFPQYGYGAKIDGAHRVRLFGIGRVRVRWHRAIPNTALIKTCRIIHRAGKWFASFVCQLPNEAELPDTKQFVGIDVGISALATLSTGEQIDNPNFYRVSQDKLRVLQRRLERKRKGSNNRFKALRIVQRHHIHISNQRRDYLHKITTKLISENDGIALENLTIRNMVRNHSLSKSILDSGWGIFKQYLIYKAANAGREIRLVEPNYTSKTCSDCGTIFHDLTLSTRWVTCGCGLSLNRDHNAAINILRKAGWDAPASANVSC
jgi:putative transposase